MKNLILVLFVAFVIFGSNTIYAQCSCAIAGESAIEEFERSDVVFVGKVIKIKKVEEIESAEFKYYDSTFDITFKVKTGWKTDSSETVTIRNISSSNSDFKEKETYLVYAKTYANNLSAYIGCCTRTGLLSKSEKDLEEFRKKGKKPEEKQILNQRKAEQINGREGETATFIKRRSLNLKLRVAVSPHVISIVMSL